MTGKRQTITIPTTLGGVERVSALVYGQLAVHDSVGCNAGAFTITHVPTGNSVCRLIASKQKAVALTHRLRRLRVWNFRDRSQFTKDTAERVKAELKSAGALQMI